MNTHDIELPPLPSLYIAPSVEPVDYPEVAQALMDYARAAVEADRKRRRPEPATDRYELALDALADLLEEAEWLQRDLNIERARNGLAPIEEGNPIANARRLLAATAPSNKRGTSANGQTAPSAV